MPKKLTILGVLAALAFGALNLFQGSASAEIQGFTPIGAEQVNTKTCYQGATPTSLATCGAGSSDVSITGAAGSPLELYSVIRLDAGSRLTLPVTYTHPAFYGAAPAIDTVTGDVTSATDLLCSSGAPDILAQATGTVPGAGAWPGSNWNGFDFTRVAQPGDVFVSHPEFAYVDDIRPQPATFALASVDAAILDGLWLNGAFFFPIDPVNLALASYTSPYGTGYRASVALLAGEPSNPPSDDYLCLDSPQHSVGATLSGAGLVIPPTGSYVRFTVFTSALDVVDGSVARILDADCVGVNTVAACDMSDADGDLVVAAVEATFGGTGAIDGDADGASDYEELFNYTDPTDSDTDNDGSLDEMDSGQDENLSPPTGTVNDTTADDNCPADANALQENEDYEPSLAGPSPGSQTDGTNPNQDAIGDECDADNDNDGTNDVAEDALRIVPWSGLTDPGGDTDDQDTTVCIGDDVPPLDGTAPLVTQNPFDADSDDDLLRDGRECQQNSRPDVANFTGPAGVADGIGTCSTAPIDPDGCAVRPAAPAGGDPDQPTPLGDQLYNPVSASAHAAVEAFYRTRQINLDAATVANDTDGDGFAGDNDKDADNDTIPDGPEVWSYGTSPANQDTDGDACTDGKEAADVNGNRTVNAQDLGLIANPAVYGTLPPTSYRAANGTATAEIWNVNADFNRNFNVNAQDLAFVAVLSTVGSPLGACNSPQIGFAFTSAHQQGRVITNHNE